VITAWLINSLNAGSVPAREAESDPLRYFVSGNRIKLEAEVRGVDPVRAGETDYVSDMKPSKGILPSPGKKTRAIEYSFLVGELIWTERQIFRPSPQPAPSGQQTDGGVINPKQFRRKSNKWAIVVGVSQFADPAISPVSYSDDDAVAMYQYLTDPDYGRFVKDQVFLMLDSDATTLRIKNAVDIISRHARPEDMVVIFISAHGTPADRDYDVENIVYMVTYDTLLHSLYTTAYSVSELIRAVRNRIRAETVVTLMDVCYSANALKRTFCKKKGAKDLAIKTQSGDVPKKMTESRLETDRICMSDSTVRELSTGKGRIFITSSKSDEQSWESDTLGHGFFSYYLLQALKMKGGEISVQEAYKHIKEEMPKAVMREKEHPQNPVMVMEDVRRDIFITAKSISAE